MMKARRLIRIMGGWVILGALLALFPHGMLGAQTVTTGISQTMGSGCVLNGAPSFGYGVNAQLIDQPIVPLLNIVTAMRFNWIRQSVRWSEIEPQPGDYRWGQLDRIVENTNLRRIYLLLVVSGTPEWARQAGSDPTYDGPPADLENFAAFMTQLASRYAGRVAAYQIWQMPNSSAYWQLSDDRDLFDNAAPAAYVQLLRAAFRAIKLQSPESFVVSAELASGSNGHDQVIEELDYLRRMGQVGGPMWHDVLAYQVDGNEFQSSRFDRNRVLNRIESIRMNVPEYTAMPVWLTGVRWGGEDKTSSSEHPELEQTQFLIEMFNMARIAPYIQVAMIDNLNLALIQPDGPAAGSSLLRHDWSAHMAIDRLATMRQSESLGFSGTLLVWTRSRSPQSGVKPYLSVSQRH
ncbi:MAG: beta-galactosidase [Anaerolineales bacterium]|nr:beta-galactosidase [Anaerolineales bacterium]